MTEPHAEARRRPRGVRASLGALSRPRGVLTRHSGLSRPPSPAQTPGKVPPPRRICAWPRPVPAGRNELPGEPPDLRARREPRWAPPRPGPGQRVLLWSALQPRCPFPPAAILRPNVSAPAPAAPPCPLPRPARPEAGGWEGGRVSAPGAHLPARTRQQPWRPGREAAPCAREASVMPRWPPGVPRSRGPAGSPATPAWPHPHPGAGRGPLVSHRPPR